MCGISGLVWKSPSAQRIEEFRAASKKLYHRGPDSFNEVANEKLYLTHHRLAIIDLSDAGKQPFSVGTGKKSIGVYNGELYNYLELSEKYNLERNTKSDTEILFKSLHERGREVIVEFNGIFAFAYVDPDQRTLLLARDRFGVKPLYFIDHPDYFAFASEAKVLYEFMSELQINPRVVHEFLRFGSSMSMDTIVSGVKKVPPGHVLEYNFDNGAITCTAYWSAKNELLKNEEKTPTFSDAVVETRHLLADAVGRQCMSDVPVGAYLSGGLDSSLVVALAARYSPGKLKTFSVNFEGSENSELPLAREVSDRFGTDHHEMEISPRCLENDLVDLILQYDEPFADPAAIPLFLMGQKCSEFAKVILQGDGGDEIFAGYGRHLDASQYWRRRFAFYWLSRLHPKQANRQRFHGRHKAMSSADNAQRLADMGVSVENLHIAKVTCGKMGENILRSDPLASFAQAAHDCAKEDFLKQSLYTEFHTILPHTFLEKVDKVSMMHSIEARVPLLDNQLVDYVSALPSSYKIRHGKTKYLLREAASDILPTSVLEGRKQSFGTPIGTWLRTIMLPFVDQVLHLARNQWSDWFDFDYIDHIKREHMEGRTNFSSLLWRLVVLFVWLDNYKNKLRLS